MNDEHLHHYTECGLDYVWLEGGFEVVESPYGRSVAIADIDGLHRCIARHLVHKSGSLTGAEFRFLRGELDLSQFAMGALCGREERSVRQWEALDAVPEPANTIIRVVYRERYEPDATYEGIARTIASLQKADKELFELKLMATDNGWQQCEAA